MRKILVYISLFISFFTFNVYAQDFFHTSLDKCDAQGQTALADHSCGVFDEDGVQIMDSGDVITSAQIGGYYPAVNVNPYLLFFSVAHNVVPLPTNGSNTTSPS